MAGNIKSARLGDILLEKGLLRDDQLKIAIAEQKRRREHIDENDKRMMDATSLGEILIELGYISRQQLKRGLNWQMYLRKMTLVMSLVAPLMSVAGGATAQTGGSSSSSSSASTQTSSLMIEAESYSAMSGVKVERTKDAGGGSNIAAIDAGDWLAYANHVIQAPQAGTYKITYRVSSLYGGGSFYLHELDTGVQYDTVSVPKTGNFQKWIDMESTITLPAGTHKLGIKAITKGFNLNWFKVEYKGAALPLTIQAESFAAMSGVKVEATTDTGGGSNIGGIDAGDWLSYENTVVNIPTSGNYKITYRTSSLYGGGGFALHEADGSAQYNVVSVPKTGSFSTYVNVERIVSLTAGAHIFGITALGKGFNINWFKIEAAPAGSVPSAPDTIAASSSSVSSAVSSVSSSTSSVVSSTSSVASSTSSAPVVSSSSSSSVSSAASSLSSAPTSSAASSSGAVAGPVYLRWNIPRLREDGSTLDISELGGYEVRYRRTTEAEYTYISIEDPWKSEHSFAWLEGSYVFEVAAFDKNGLYSKFIAVAPN